MSTTKQDIEAIAATLGTLQEQLKRLAQNFDFGTIAPPAKTPEPIAGGIHPTCPECGKPMAVRLNKAKGTNFFGCTAYPRCKGTINIKPGVNPADFLL